MPISEASFNPISAKSLGICLGASTLSVTERLNGKVKISQMTHGGKVEELVRNIVENAVPAMIGITGRKFRDLMAITTISEPEAIELAYDHIKPKYHGIDSILSAGSESILLYTLEDRGRISSVVTGNKCASGTGEFFLQQLKRMDLELDHAIDIAACSAPYDIAHRCSVFSKSDCTHALNKGVEKGRVTAGLCRMMALKMVELLKSAKVKSTLVVGGISQNPVVMGYLKELFPETTVPEEAPYFEALGAMLWAECNGPLTETCNGLFKPSHHLFSTLPDLNTGLANVAFKTSAKGCFEDVEYIIGLDVGSTTTKAVLMRTDNQAVVASEYLRTMGDPIGASRRCYKALLDRAPDDLKPKVIGLGATGSGRRLAGLHALTDNVVNEIVAHAVAAVHFDPEVDTIFEIGGQDAKYTAITNMVPTDYAMNEACSAGTGSFLEEACSESFQISTSSIEETALNSRAPLNFSDQCAAFIGSDIKTAIQSGTTLDDNVAGMVYSVCRNYLNRVKGNRPIGRKIFMQGGVCYNRAVPLAMSILCDREIVVPPDPGLMGAFGAALVVMQRLEDGLTVRHHLNLSELASRKITQGKPFICGGGREKCDRKCRIDRYSINDETYPFGGACDKYFNLRKDTHPVDPGIDLVRVREDLVNNKYAPRQSNQDGRIVGIPTSLYTATAYPLYAHFFTNLGMRIARSEKPDSEGMELAASPFCLPVLQAHGFLKNLLTQEPDYVFVPHVKTAFSDGNEGINCTCPLLQGEPYYLRATFHDDLAPRLLTDVLDFNSSGNLREAFVRIGDQLGHNRRRSSEAFDRAWLAFQALHKEMRENGNRLLSSLGNDDIVIVLLGRAYNAFTGYGNMGVPQKFASRGLPVIPFDFLPLDEAGGSSLEKMYWAAGQGILKAAELIRNTPNYYGVYVTNFSCGPDSFIIERFRNVMGQKPFLTLEFDTHTADAGIDTRVDAFLDIIRGYVSLDRPSDTSADFQSAQVVIRNGKPVVMTSGNRSLAITDPQVHMVIPSMGETGTGFLAAAMRRFGIRTTAIPAPGPEEMSLGKSVTSCKECLPYTLTTGSLFRYLAERKKQDEVLICFLPEANGPCRFGQFNVSIGEIIRKHRIKDVALLSLSSENGYAGLPTKFTSHAVQAMILSDGLEDVHAGILALAEDREGALQILDRAKERICHGLEFSSHSQTLSILEEEMKKLATYKKKISIENATKISLTGEIYVRKDNFSRQGLVETLADKGIVTKTAPVYEWFLYTLHSIARGLSQETVPRRDRFAARLKTFYVKRMETRVHQRLGLSGFCDTHSIDMEYLLDRGSALIDPRLTGEAILTVSSALKEIGDDTHGVISIGPFGCMPSRIAESILTHRRREEKHRFSKKNGAFWARNRDQLALPFLAIETDGSNFPQLIEAKLESLILSAERLKTELSNKGLR